MTAHPTEIAPPLPATTAREAYYNGIRERASNYPGADASAAELLVHLFYTTDVVEVRVARVMAAHGISNAAFNLLMILHNSKDGARSLHEISDLLLVSRANVTGLIDCLEQRGFVAREIDARDRRVRIARLLDTGRALLEQVLPEHHQAIQRLCAQLPEEERATLVTLLRKLRASAESTTQ